MAYRRRSYSYGGNPLLAVIVLFVIGIIVAAINFVIKYYKEIFLFVVLPICILFVIIWILNKGINKKNKKIEINSYCSTPFYIETKTPYSAELLERGKSFEMLVYNRLRERLGYDYKILYNLSIPQKNAFNIDSQIDFVVFHSTGIYVLEVKDYSGPLVGRIDEDQWVPYLAVIDKNSTRPDGEKYVINHFIYNDWVKTNKKTNPVKQNAVHIRALNDIYKADYMNIVIFSKFMFVESSSNEKTIDNIYRIGEFIEAVKLKTPVYNQVQLDEAYDTIQRYNRGAGVEIEGLHIARISNQK